MSEYKYIRKYVFIFQKKNKTTKNKEDNVAISDNISVRNYSYVALIYFLLKN